MALRSVDMMDAAAVADLLHANVARRRPFSFIRLGDGEGTLSAFSDASRLEDLVYFHSHFGPEVSIDQVRQIRANMEQAIASADLIGVRDDISDAAPGATGLDPCDGRFHENFREMFVLRPVERNLKPYAARRIFNLFRRVEEGFPQQPALCSQWVCYDLAKLGFWDDLLSGIGRVSIITSSRTLEARLRRRFGLQVEALIVPRKAIDATRAGETGQGHYPHAYRSIRAALQRPLDGRVFLVGAGLAGKHYLHLVKQAGGIALDVGALLDAWASHATRRLVHASKAPLQASPYSAPADFRLAAGRLHATEKQGQQRLVLHAGFSRTASTAVQAAFAANKQAFLEAGVNYVDAARGGAINHHQLARAFGMGEHETRADRPLLLGLLEEIAAEVASLPGRVHVVSSELLTNTSPNPETEDDLIEFLNSYDTRVVCMVRNQYDWLLSWYAKAARNRNVDAPLKDFLLNPPLEKFDGNFIRKLDWFEKYAPQGSVRVVSYDENRADPLSAVAAAGEMPVPEGVRLGIENASPNPSRTVSGFAARRMGVPIKPLLGVRWPPEVVDELMLLDGHKGMRDQLRVVLMDRFEHVNAALRERYGIRIGGTVPDS